MSRKAVCGLLLHFLLVEMRPVYFFYLASTCMIRTSAVILFSMTRSLGGNEDKCMEPSCVSSLNARMQCISTGIADAMWSLDLNFSSETTCVEFHGSNFVGIMHLPGLIIMCMTVVMIAKNLAFAEGACYLNGAYVSFTKYLPRHPAIRRLAIALVAYVFLLMIIGMLVPMFFINKKYLDDEGLTVIEALHQWIRSTIFQWVALAISAFFLATTEEPVFDCHSAYFKQLEFRWTWYDFFMQTNSGLTSKFERALLQAKCGDTRSLASILMEPEKAEEVMAKLHPSTFLGNDSSDKQSGYFKM